MNSVFSYQDYRAYLRDFYNEKKRTNRSYSYRLFSIRAGLGSPNYLKLVIDGKRRITEATVDKFARGLKLEGAEAQYFRELALGGRPAESGYHAVNTA